MTTDTEALAQKSPRPRIVFCDVCGAASGHIMDNGTLECHGCGKARALTARPSDDRADAERFRFITQNISAISDVESPISGRRIEVTFWMNIPEYRGDIRALIDAAKDGGKKHDQADVWKPIETAPKDGTKVWVKRVHAGSIVKEGWAVFDVLCADAPIRKPVPPDPLGRSLPSEISEDINCADKLQWLTTDKMYLFPEPTHWVRAEATP